MQPFKPIVAHALPLTRPGESVGHEPVAAAPGSVDDARERQRAQDAARQFESFFIAQTLKEMRAGTRAMAGEGSVFSDPVNDDLLDLADSMVADQMARQHAFGIADVILRQLLPDAPAPSETPPLSGGTNPVAS